MPREGTIPGPVTERIENWVSAPEARTYTSHQRSLHHIAPPSVTETGNRAISLPPPPSAPNCRKQSLLTSPRASSAQGDPWPHTREGEEVITDLLQSSPGRSVKIPPSGWWTYMGTRATPRILETSMWSNFANKNTEIQRNENTRSSSHSGRTELHLRNRNFWGAAKYKEASRDTYTLKLDSIDSQPTALPHLCDGNILILFWFPALSLWFWRAACIPSFRNKSQLSQASDLTLSSLSEIS